MKEGEHKLMTNEKFKIVIEKYEKLVFTICFQMVRDYQEAQNLTQETFISAFNNIDRCNENSYKPWLCKIAANKSKDYLKSAYCKHVVLDGEDETFDRQSNFEQPEKEYLGKESVENIENIIRGLKEPYLKVSVLYFIEEKNIQEISDILKRPKKTVQTQIQRAKGIIKEKLMQGGAI